jgi:hypothetical protein
VLVDHEDRDGRPGPGEDFAGGREAREDLAPGAPAASIECA